MFRPVTDRARRLLSVPVTENDRGLASFLTVYHFSFYCCQFLPSRSRSCSKPCRLRSLHFLAGVSTVVTWKCLISVSERAAPCPPQSEARAGTCLSGAASPPPCWLRCPDPRATVHAARRTCRTWTGPSRPGRRGPAPASLRPRQARRPHLTSLLSLAPGAASASAGRHAAEEHLLGAPDSGLQ